MSYSKANFSYILRREEQVIAIIDEFDNANPSMSVTNDIENVLKDIEKRENINAKDFIIVYRDTDYYWCGWDAKLNSFLHFLVDSETKAVEEYKTYNHG